MKYGIRLKIADTVFQVFSDSKKPILWLRERYQRFFSSLEPDFHVFITLDKNWKKRPSSFLAPRPVLTDSRFSAQTRFFDVRIDFTRRKATVTADPEFGIVPTLAFLCSAVLMKNGGFLLHASAVLKDRFSYVFFGPSESGKTTIARLSKGKTVLTDETAAIVRHNGRYSAYATPFAGEFGDVDENTGGPIKAIFLLRKDSSFGCRALKKSDAVRQLFCNARMPIGSAIMANTLFDTFEGLATKTPCYELSFKPEPKIWRYIDGFIK